MLSVEAINTNAIVFGLTRSGFEHRVYSTRGVHANNYTTGAFAVNRTTTDNAMAKRKRDIRTNYDLQTLHRTLKIE
jgi:hypothetical protein